MIMDALKLKQIFQLRKALNVLLMSVKRNSTSGLIMEKVIAPNKKNMIM